MITLEEAKSLKKGEILICNGARWKVNGIVKTWKRDAARIEVPLKHGLYDYATLTESLLDIVEKGK